MIYSSITETSYSRQNWLDLLHDIFASQSTFFANPITVENINSNIATRAEYLGKITTSDGYNLAVYEVELAPSVNVERNRAAIRNLLNTHWKYLDLCAGALMLCYKPNEKLMRFSYVSASWTFDSEGNYVYNETSTKRFTYLAGEGIHCRTLNERLETLKRSPKALADISEAFSVEALTKQFYTELFSWYDAATKNQNVYFPNDIDTEDDDFEQKEIHLIRLLTRILFVWFIKQKDLIPNQIFIEDQVRNLLKDFNPNSDTDTNYYQAILQNLFFATLNCPISIRGFRAPTSNHDTSIYRYANLFAIPEAEVVKLFSSCPYLNGGIFECLDKLPDNNNQRKIYHDGFSNNATKHAAGRYKRRASIPNNLFFDPDKGLIPILNRYNFTVEENTPMDQTVALEPELLGKVFENLLATFNPETQESARKMTGSFYTPREIVEYMSREAISAYLISSCPSLADIINDLFSPNFKKSIMHEGDYIQITDALKKVRILDPACGSGAFPMQMLNILVELHQKLDPKLDPFSTKLQIIRDNLFGLDIQPIAMMICKLRFFISLITEQGRNDSEENFGIHPLPNLETRFIAANTLLQISRTANLFDQEINKLNNERIDLNKKYISTHSIAQKQTIKARDRELKHLIADAMLKQGNCTSQAAQQMADWSPFDIHASAPFFDPEWMFGTTNFDIVIGNPPYIQLQKNGGTLAEAYQNQNYQTFARTGDIYALFYERGQQLLSDGGHLCFITSNKWMRAGYGEKLRAFLSQHTNPQLLIDFAGVKIFDSATVDTNILLFQKAPNTLATRAITTNNLTKADLDHLATYAATHATTCHFDTADSWVILSPAEAAIKQKIEQRGTPLKDWDININYGIKTGFNDAFIISTETRNQILEGCKSPEEQQRTEQLIRPILRGRDIKRYTYQWAELWLIATFPALHYDIEQFPAVKNYLLDNFGMQRLEQTGKTYNGVKARKKTSNKWFEVQDTIAYHQEFNKPKIVYPETTQGAYFVYDDSGIFIEKTCFMIVGDVDLQFLQAILSSKFMEFAYKRFFSSIELGANGYQYNKHAFERLPIPRPTPSQSQHFATLLAAKDYAAIDKAVYELYGLTEEEIAVVEK